MLSSISRSKDNETTKVGQLIEYNTINIFLVVCGKETIPRLFSKTQN